MVTGVGISFGKRIELARRRRGLSRELLGDLIGRSSEWVRQVERDTRSVDRLSVLLLLAKTLKIADVGAFLGCASPEPGSSQGGGGSPAITAVLRDVLYGQRFQGQGGRTGRPQLEAILSGWESSPKPYSRVLQGLPGLISTLGEGEEEISAHAHRLASTVLRRLGDLPPALLAAERAVTAADRTADPAVQMLCAGTFAEALVALGSPARARQVCATALAGPAVRSGQEAMLHLVCAGAAVADDDHAAAEQHLHHARSVSAEHGTAEVEVEAEAATIALAQGRHRLALRLAQTVDAQRLRTRERRARHYLTVATAHARDNNSPATVFSLLKAEDACPEETRFNPEARHLVQDLMRRDNALVRHDVWALAERTGLA